MIQYLNHGKGYLAYIARHKIDGMRRRFYTIFWFFILGVSLGIEAHPFYFKQYQVQDGLSNNNITCSLQDSHGFMWFGTRDGLNRFDGYSFRVFRDDPDLPKSIGSSYIQSLALDKNKRLWVATYMGIYVYDGVDESFELVNFTKGMRARKMVFNAEGELWAILDGRLVKYNEPLDSYQTYTIPDNGYLNSLCITPLGRVWVVLSNGMLYEFNEESGEFRGFDLFSHSNDYTLRNLTCVYPAASGDKLFIGSSTHGAKLFDIRTGTYTDLMEEEVRKSEISVQDFIQINPEEVWIATESGLYIYSMTSNRYSTIRKRPYDPYSLSTNSLYNFCKDHENGIWIGSYSGGVNYYSPFQPFTKYYAYPGESVLKGDLVHDIVTDRYDNLWIATEDAGLNKLDVKTGKYINYQPQPGQKSIARTNLHGLVAEGDRLWVGSLIGIDLLDIRSGEVLKHYTLGDNSSIVIMKKLPNGMLLVGTSNGMYYYEEEADRFVLHPAFPTLYRIQSILEDHLGKIWVGTAHYGVYCYDPADDSIEPFVLEESPTFSDNVVNDIYEDEDYNLWFASFNGVKKWDWLSGDVTRYTVKNGMPANSTFRILADGDKNLWISTTNGLVCLDPVTERIRVYTREHGIITNQFNYNSSWKDASGRMYFGMVKGMISFMPEAIEEFMNEAHVYLTHMTVFDKEADMNIPTFPVTLRENIMLTHEQSTFSIDFSSLSYIAPGITEYAYNMEGLDNNWTYLKNSHTAYYTKLRPGNYVFKVRGSNVSGVWSDVPTTLRITILQPWWFSSSAILVYVCLFIAASLLTVRLFIHKNKWRMQRDMQQFEDEKERELYQAKIDFFINIAHEIRTPLTLIRSPLDKVMNNRGLPEDAKDYLLIVNKNANRLLALVNQLLDFRKTEIEGYNLNFVQIDIVALVHDICSRFRDTAEGASLLLNVQANVKILKAFVDKEAFTKIISNLLSNAIKYAKTNIQLSILFIENEEQLFIDVTNDGEVIPIELRDKIFEPFFRGEYSIHKSGTGLGLPLARSLAEMHRGTLSVEDMGLGLTTFRLCVPVYQPNSIRLEEQTGVGAVNQPIYDMDPSRPTVLVVEDNLEMRNFIAREVHSEYNVVMAEHGHEALLLLHEWSVQLIISDIMMPVMDGFELLKKVKTELEFSHIPILLLTAKNTMQSRLDGLELGADAYIEKPFSMDLVMAQIANLLNNRNSMRAYYFNSPIANMKSMAYTKADEYFLERLNEIIVAEIDNPNLDVDLIAGQMNMSRPTLYRKINALSNLTPNELINITRLKKAAEFILAGKMKIYEISEAVGFNSQSYFSRSFSKQFGMTPSQYAQINHVKL